jgi:dGTPase
VGQIARSVAGALNLNVDFAETLALAHDLGHTPFGHSGQETLHELMLHHGGFEHNRQSLRIVSELEVRYPSFNGLNLTRSTLKGVMKRGEIYDCDTDLKKVCEERSRENPSLEAALVDLCDRIAYNHHDLEDGLDSGFLDMEMLTGLSVWNEAYRRVKDDYGGKFEETRLPVRIRTVIRAMMNGCITDLIQATKDNIKSVGIETLDDLLSLDPARFPARFSEDMNDILIQMQHFLKIRLYRHPLVMRMSRRGSRIIGFLFHEYIENPEILPSHVQQRVARHGIHRVVSDYISGMTDRYALEQYTYLSGGK